MSENEGSNNQNSSSNQFSPIQSLQKLIFEFESAKKLLESQKKENGELKSKINVVQREKQQIFESAYHLNLIAHQGEIILQKALNLFEQIKLEIDPTQRQQFEESLKRISQGVSLEEIENKVSGHMNEMFPFEKDFQIIVPSVEQRRPRIRTKRLFPTNDGTPNIQEETDEETEPPKKKRKLEHLDSPPSRIGNPTVGNVPVIPPISKKTQLPPRPSTSTSTIVPPPPYRTPDTERSIQMSNRRSGDSSTIIPRPPPSLNFGGGVYRHRKIGIHEWIKRERFRGLPPRSPVPMNFYPAVQPRLTQTIHLDQVTTVLPLNDHLLVLGRTGSLHFYRKNVNQVNHVPLKTIKVYDENNNNMPYIIRAIEHHHYYPSSPQSVLGNSNNSNPLGINSPRILVCGHHPNSYSLDLNKCIVARTFSSPPNQNLYSTKMYTSPSSFLPHIFPNISTHENNNKEEEEEEDDEDDELELEEENLEFYYRQREQYKILQMLQPQHICNYTICSSEDGRDIFVGGNQSIIQKFDFRSPKCVEFFQGHTQGTSISHLKLLYSHNSGRCLVSSGTDKTVRLWDLRYNNKSGAGTLEYNEFYSSTDDDDENNNIRMNRGLVSLRRRRRNSRNNGGSNNPYVIEDEEKVSEEEQKIMERIKQTKESKKRVINKFDMRRKKKKKLSSSPSSLNNNNIEEEEEDDDEDEDEPKIILSSSENESFLNHGSFFEQSNNNNESQKKGGGRRRKKKKKKKKDPAPEITKSRNKMIEKFGEIKCFVTKFENVGFSCHPYFPHMINVIGSEGQEFIDLKTCEHCTYNYQYPHNSVIMNENTSSSSSSSSEEEEEEEENRKKRKKKRKKKKKKKKKKNTKFYTSIDTEPVFGSWFVCGGLEGQIEFINCPRGPVIYKFPCSSSSPSSSLSNNNNSSGISSSSSNSSSNKIVDIKMIPSSRNLTSGRNQQSNGYLLDMFVVTSQCVQKYSIKNDVRINLKI